ncbi:MAG: acyltransferase [Bacteroidales bacterium]|jgi:hypothetical protein|nr:acyltransferase [Bacteroidales bacterium]
MNSSNYNKIWREVFKIDTPERFEELAMDIFSYQSLHCKVYNEYLSLLGTDIRNISGTEQIPFLPIRFFKSRTVTTGDPSDRHMVFTSSATTGMVPSRHFVNNLNVYDADLMCGFEKFYGDPSGYSILALLPSYLEREGSSLVYMADKLIKKSGDGGFYLYDYEALHEKLEKLKKGHKKVLLIGVSFALLDFVEKYKTVFPNLIVMETGGMKGRKREISRKELHQKLAAGFGVKDIHSEYGMAELLSQAYSSGDGLFSTPPWMKIYLRDMFDPSIINKYASPETGGGINIIDLGNCYSCAFIETEDNGHFSADGRFAVDGRIRNSELRGCNMLLGDV